MNTEIKVLRDYQDYRRIEIQTDGEIVKIGRKIDGDRCIEARYEHFTDFLDKVKRQSQVDKYTLESESYGDVSYIVDSGNQLDVYRDRKHVLHCPSHEFTPLYSAVERAYNRRNSFDYEELTESYVKSKIPAYWTISYLDDRTGDGKRVQVEVINESRTVSMNFVDDMRSEDPVEFGGVHFEDDETKYQFTVRADTLPGAS